MLVRRRSRGGFGLLMLLAALLIVAYLYHRGMLDLTPRGIGPGTGPTQEQAAGVVGQAGKAQFDMTARQVQSAAESFEIRLGRKPRDLTDLHLETGIDLKKDPWGGEYRVESGVLRCSGNDSVATQVW